MLKYRNSVSRITKYQRTLEDLKLYLEKNRVNGLHEYFAGCNLMGYATTGLLATKIVVKDHEDCYKWNTGPVTYSLAEDWYNASSDMARHVRYKRMLAQGNSLNHDQKQFLRVFQGPPNLAEKHRDKSTKDLFTPVDITDEDLFVPKSVEPEPEPKIEDLGHGSTLVLETADGSLYEFTAKGEPSDEPVLHETITYYLFGLIRVRKRFIYKSLTLPKPE